MTETAHTPTPWIIEEGNSINTQFVIEDDNGYCIATVGPEWSSIRNRKIVKANAELITKACSNHYQLVAELSAMIEFFDHPETNKHPYAKTHLQAARAILAKVQP